MDREHIIRNCKKLLLAFEQGDLGQTKMPEDAHPVFSSIEERLAYFTLPMALNYQRNSYSLWESALQTFENDSTKDVFSVSAVASMPVEGLRTKLMKYKVALQPNKHIATWKTICETILSGWRSIEQLVAASNNDFLQLRELVQNKHKKGFPYLSGPKIFHYWSFILQTYGEIALKNAEYIEIAPDTHVTKCSVLLGVITEKEAETMSKQEISVRWREVLLGSGIPPIQMHPPLWFWSRNGFLYPL